MIITVHFLIVVAVAAVTERSKTHLFSLKIVKFYVIFLGVGGGVGRGKAVIPPLF